MNRRRNRIYAPRGASTGGGSAASRGGSAATPGNKSRIGPLAVFEGALALPAGWSELFLAIFKALLCNSLLYVWCLYVAFATARVAVFFILQPF